GFGFRTKMGPAAKFSALADEYSNEGLRLLNSVDIVLTNDKSKWSRCFVLETSDDAAEIANYPNDDAVLSEGGAYKLMPRNAPSVDKNGNPDGTGNGKGWFPGYAINLETGERLNIMFGESSWLRGENGADMIWNPSETDYTEVTYDFGGKHYIYVVKSRGVFDGTGKQKKEYMARYDSCNYIGQLYDNFKGPQRRAFFRNLMWTGIPMVFDSTKLLANDAIIKIRVEKPFEGNYTKLEADLEVESVRNNNLPMYSFNTRGLHATRGSDTAAASAMDLIRAVPNPYYGFSSYEGSGAETKIKITNLPNRCKLSIYTLDGVLVRVLEKDDDQQTYLEWNLKNLANIPISSGLYIMHIDGYENGEKVLKWFGAMRPFDFSGL
ncbi:MAG: T9SS type A sorting domain-containing protein, partial [Flavobacteriales bacterium]|nr:T9SS type A sorting domain-containing protein [Flavobacteriales bacterium]